MHQKTFKHVVNTCIRVEKLVWSEPKFPRFPSVPNFLLGIASGFVRALTRKSGEKMNIRFVADSTPQNGKNPSRHNLDIIPPEGLQVSDLSISPFWDGHSIFGEKVTQNEQIWHFYT